MSLLMQAFRFGLLCSGLLVVFPSRYGEMAGQREGAAWLLMLSFSKDYKMLRSRLYS